MTAQQKPRVRPEVAVPITDRASAMRYIDGLVAAGLEFHFEEDPSNIVRLGTGEATFSPEEVLFLRRRLRTLYSLGWAEDGCPIGYMLRAIGRRELRHALASAARLDASRDWAVTVDYRKWRREGNRPSRRVDLETRVTELLTREFETGEVCPSCGGRTCCCPRLVDDAVGLKMGANR